MQIKNNIYSIIVLCIFLFNFGVNADEFNISAVEITIDKQNNIIIGKGSVVATDKQGQIIKANKIIYKKSKELLEAEGSVEIIDNDDNVLTTDSATYDKPKNIINSYKNSILITKDDYKLKSNRIIYNTEKKLISSPQDSILTDSDGNIVTSTMFQYDLEKKMFSSIGNIKIIDANKNKYFFKELHVDTAKKEIIGSDVSALLDQESFGMSKENDPRFVANDIYISEMKSNMSKGIFTVCKKRDGKCPPWSLWAKKISHDKTKKTIYYDHAVLKVYDVPIFYFPKFFHPDPTVKRQSGFLNPIFTNSTTLGAGFGLPYYWAISHNRDMTFTPKTYANENILFLNEYRQAFKNGFFILDTSYTEGYKETSETKTKGSRNHIFAQLDFDFAAEKDYESTLSLKMQKVSNDTYFQIHDIDTALVDSENTNLENKISYSFNKNNAFLNISGTIYEDLSDKTNDRYEYILPNILFGKFGTLDFKSNTLYKNYDGNKYNTILTNDIIWNPSNVITKNGFVNTFEIQAKNTNYEAKNTTDYKTEGVINEISGVVKYKTSLPLKKEGDGYYNLFSPNFMIRYAPGHMKHLAGDDIMLSYTNLYATNKTAEIESGLSAILGFDYKTNTKTNDGTNKEKFAISLGQVFNLEENKKIPSSSSLDQKTSDIVGEMNYNFSKIGNINYKFSLDHDLNTLNYNEISTGLNLGKIDFNLDYLEQRNHIGKEHYVQSGIDLNFNDRNKLSFETKKNFKTSSTELYDISYQYTIDCLTAGLAFRREFYYDKDTDIEPKDSLMFVIRFKPFTGVTAPLLARDKN